jgi:hypothetical protein
MSGATIVAKTNLFMVIVSSRFSPSQSQPCCAPGNLLRADVHFSHIDDTAYHVSREGGAKSLFNL